MPGGGGARSKLRSAGPTGAGGIEPSRQAVTETDRRIDNLLRAGLECAGGGVHGGSKPNIAA